MCLDVSTGGELHVALSAGVPADRLVLHGNNKSDRRAGRRAGRRGRPHRRRLLRRDRPARARSCRRRAVVPSRRVLVRITPGVEVHTHEFVRTGQDDSKFGFGLASGRPRRRPSTVPSRRRRSSSSGSTPTSGARSSRPLFAQAVEVLAASSPPRPARAVVGGGLGVAYVERRGGPAHGRVGRRRCAGPAATPVSPTVRVTAEPGRSIVAAAAHHPLPGGHGQGRARHPDLRLGRRRHERQPAPGALRQRVRGVPGPRASTPPPRAVRVVGKHCETGDVVVREGGVPADLAVGDILATPVTGAYGHSMASNYNKVPRPAVVFVADGDARAGRASRDRRRSAGRRVGE